MTITSPESPHLCHQVTRPDGKKENLGLTMLDEPAAKQSDPSVLELQLRAISKQSSAKSVQIRKIDSGEKSAKEIDKWIKDISDLHRSKPPPTVHYTKPMPDIDRLMQEWPPEVEEMLKETGIPTAGIIRSERLKYVTVTDIVSYFQSTNAPSRRTSTFAAPFLTSRCTSPASSRYTYSSRYTRRSETLSTSISSRTTTWRTSNRREWNSEWCQTHTHTHTSSHHTQT